MQDYIKYNLRALALAAQKKISLLSPFPILFL